jgi:hypothetical protein
MNTNIINLPDNKKTELNLYILDPLSVIIKLAILSNKPVGTKICIDNNIVYLQEPGPFQAFCRFIFKSNKTDIQFFYNPIEIACKNYLNKNVIQQHSKIKELFKCAQNGIKKLAETYKTCSVIQLCLNYYLSLISNHLEDNHNETLFIPDNMSIFYTQDIITKMNKNWTSEKIKVILNLITYLNNTEHGDIDVVSLETIMISIDNANKNLL